MGGKSGFHRQREDLNGKAKIYLVTLNVRVKISADLPKPCHIDNSTMIF